MVLFPVSHTPTPLHFRIHCLVCVGVEIKKLFSRAPKNTAVHTKAKVNSSFYSRLLQLAVKLYITSTKPSSSWRRPVNSKQPLRHQVALSIN